MYSRVLNKRQRLEIKQEYLLIYQQSKDYTAYIIDLKGEQFQTHQIYLTNEYQLLDYYQQLIYLRRFRVNYNWEAVACCQIKNYIRRNKKIQKIFSKYFQDQNLQVQKYGISLSQSWEFNKVIVRIEIKTIRIIKTSNCFTPSSVNYQDELCLSIQQDFIIQYQRTYDIWHQLYLTDITKGNKQLVGKVTKNHNIFDTQISPDRRFIYISPFLHKLSNFQEQEYIDGHVQFSDCSQYIIQFQNQQLNFISLKSFDSEYKIDLPYDQIIPQSIQVQAKQQKIIFVTRQMKDIILDERRRLEKVIWIHKYERKL